MRSAHGYHPENEDPSFKYDVYSFGSVAWRLITGIDPVSGGPSENRLNAPGSGRPSENRLNALVRDKNLNDLIRQCWKPVAERPDMETVEEIIWNWKLEVIFRDFLANYLWTYVAQSTTRHLSVGATRTVVANMRSVQLASASVEQDLQRFFSPAQLQQLAFGVRSETFIQGIDLSKMVGLVDRTNGSPMSSIQQKNTNNCIYLWRNKVTRRGYVGISERQRYVRDHEHLAKSVSQFDQQVQRLEDWEIITITYTQTAENPALDLKRLETLLIILLNTSLHRQNAMGFNDKLNG